MKTSRTNSRKRDQNYLPTQICTSFFEEISTLVDSLDQGFKSDYLKSEYLSKYCDTGVTGADTRRAAAIQKWMAVEVENRKSNMRLLFEEDLGWIESDVLVETVRKIISGILGPCDGAHIFKYGNHTNGASTRVRRSPSAAISKHLGEAHITESALKHWFTFASGTQLSNQDLKLVDSSVLFTVPKKSDIDRVACKEPEINMLLQRCVGSAIRRRLRKKNIDLNDQTINQRLAKSALQDGLATIDLSSASDSISRSLVQLLLPTDWWSMLDDLRVATAVVENNGSVEIHDLEMFSSMGNGFTFELESLIFYALTRGICYLTGTKGRISVYGDDIICPSVIAARVARTFSWFGFKVNTKKSNWTGSFRESCGKHYHKSLDVTPFYIREPIRQKTDVIRLLNRLLQWDGGELRCLTTPSIIAFHRKWASIIPKELHGGQDPEVDNSLVTGDTPRMRILFRKRPLKFSSRAALLYWLTVKESAHDTLTCDPAEEGRAFICSNTQYCRNVSWDPYLMIRKTFDITSTEYSSFEDSNFLTAEL